MLDYKRSFLGFNGPELRELLEENKRKVRDRIEHETESTIIDANEIKYINKIINEFTIKIPDIDFENYSVNYFKKEKIYTCFPETYRFLSTKSLNEVVICFLHFKGNAELLEYTPRTRSYGWIEELCITNDDVCFVVIPYDNNREEIKKKIDNTKEKIKTHLGYLNEQIKEYNDELEIEIKKRFKEIKSKYIDQRTNLKSLGVPIKEIKDKSEISEDYFFRRKVNHKYKPLTESKLEKSSTLTYHEILQNLYEIGKSLERDPYSSKRDEEELRTTIISTLEARIKETVTGESFNRNGKSDILIRHKNENLLIAECKIWRGKEVYLESITQLFDNYLNWRDTETAIILFVRNEKFTEVLEKIKKITPIHPNYVKYINEEDNSWFNYCFRSNHDPDQKIQLAIISFHFPETKGR